MPDIPAVLVILEKGGVVAMLLLNSAIVYKFGIAGIRQILDGSWVPGRYYKDVCEDRDRLRAENDAYRSVTLRAVGVVERVAGS